MSSSYRGLGLTLPFSVLGLLSWLVSVLCFESSGFKPVVLGIILPLSQGEPLWAYRVYSHLFWFGLLMYCTLERFLIGTINFFGVNQQLLSKPSLPFLSGSGSHADLWKLISPNASSATIEVWGNWRRFPTGLVAVIVWTPFMVLVGFDCNFLKPRKKSI